MARPGRLPVETPDDDKIVCHVDMDCFYASCERLREPALRGEPVVVGMGYESGETTGAVATASYEAREYGVESAQAIETALEKLPRRETAAAVEGPTAYYRPVDMEYYQEISEQVQSLLEQRADVMRTVSIDEAYLDVTSRTDWDGVESFARDLKETISESVGVVASVGVAPSMSAAKIASDAKKPDGLVILEPGEVRDFLAPMDVEEIHSVGPTTAGELRSMGIETAGDLAEADPDRIEHRFGERGRAIYRFARGEDDRDVTPRDDPKSLSRESAFPQPIEDYEQVRDRVQTLASAVADRATRKNALYQTVGIKVVEPPYDVNTRAHSLSGPVDDPELLDTVALELLEEFEGETVRKVGVRVSKLTFTDREQVSLDGFGGQETTTDRSSDGRSSAVDDQKKPAESHRLRGQTSLSDFH